MEQCGRGGEGTLYLARDMELGSLRAVKVLPPEKKREAELLRLMEHPAIPAMTDLVQTEEFCCLVMEYIRGRSMGEWLEAGRNFSTGEILDLSLEITEVLGYLHGRKPPVFYGDLKPENLMLGENGKLYLVDFGSAVMGYQEKHGLCMGTKGFAAPEQFQGKISPASDVYALGKTIQALAGKNRLKITAAVPELSFFVKKCCRKQEKYRFQTMTEAAKRLHKIKEQKNRRLHRIIACSLMVMSFLMVKAFLPHKPEDFYAALTEVTNLYKWEAMKAGSETEKQELCKKTEKKLQELLTRYPEEQKKLLLLLAANCEIQKNEQRAALYYEQYLLYFPEDVQGYGEYGMFLWRQGQKNASVRLWTDYIENVRAGIIKNHHEKGYDFLKWRDRINEWKKEENNGNDFALDAVPAAESQGR